MATKNTSSATRRKTTTRRRPSAPKGTKQQSAVHTMPTWMRNLLAVVIVLVFSAVFYWFFIRPYSYRWKPCYGQKGYGVCMPCNYEVHGIDISHYQGHINWEELIHNKETKFPIHFVFMKATEGGDLSDETFTKNFDLAHEHGFIRGAYHYFVPTTDADKQADFFISTVQLLPGDLPPVLDVETTGKLPPKELKAAVKTWLDRAEGHYGVKPILYTSYKFKQRYLNDSVFNTYPYWIAHYYVDSVRYDGQWHFWQHTDVGSVPGIKEDVDLDVFNGTFEELLALTLQP